jgi:queuine tRNA-ribosyltransferase
VTHEVVTTRGGARAMLDHETGEVMHPVVGPLIEASRLYVTPARVRERLQLAPGGLGAALLADATGPGPASLALPGAGLGAARSTPGAEPSSRASFSTDPDASSLVLLDAGLGAGSNAIAAWRVAHELVGPSRRLEIVSVDRTLSALALALQPEHAVAFGFEGTAGVAARALLTDHRHEDARSCWRLRLGDLVEQLAHEPAASVDIVFWDPFSPRADATLWNVRAFAALRRVCRPGATVHTYSGATATRSAMLLAGFAVGYGDAAGDKQKHTTIAAVSVSDLQRPLDQRWLERLSRSSSAWPADAPDDAFASVARAEQFR